MTFDAQSTGSRYEELVELTSQSDWDDEGGVVIDPKRWLAAKDLIEVIGAEVPSAPDAYLSPSGDGGIHIIWQDAEQSLSVRLNETSLRWVTRARGERLSFASERTSDLVQAVRSFFAYAR